LFANLFLEEDYSLTWFPRNDLLRTFIYSLLLFQLFDHSFCIKQTMAGFHRMVDRMPESGRSAAVFGYHAHKALE
jgi:hypothetical protein